MKKLKPQTVVGNCGSCGPVKLSIVVAGHMANEFENPIAFGHEESLDVRQCVNAGENCPIIEQHLSDLRSKYRI